MYKRDYSSLKNVELPVDPNDYQGQAQYWCNMLGITPDQLNEMSEQEMEQRLQQFQKNYKSSKSPDRHAAFQTMKEQGGSPSVSPRARSAPTPKNTPRFREEDIPRARPESPQRSSRRAAAKKAAAAKIQQQLDEEAALEAQEQRQRYDQMKMMQEKQFFQQKQMREQEIREKQIAKKRQEDMRRHEEMRRQEEMSRQEELKRQEEFKRQEEIKLQEETERLEEIKRRQRQMKQAELQQRNLDLQSSQSPDRSNRMRSPRRGASPTRKQFYDEVQRQNQINEEVQRQNQINEDLQRQRYLKHLEEEKQKLYAKQFQKQKQKQIEKQRIFEEQQRQLLEDQLLSQQQDQEYQTDEVPSPEEGEVTEATDATEAEEAESTNENEYDEDGRLEGGLDTCDEGGRDMWGILSNAAESIEGRYGQSSGPRASSYPPGKASYRIKGVDVNKNTFDLNASFDGPSNQINYQNRVFKKAPDSYETGGQDYIDYEGGQEFERGGQDYGACDYQDYDQSSADGLENDPDFEDVGPSPRPNYLNMNPKVRTITSYKAEYSEDAIDESEHNVTVENDGEKQTLRVQARSFVGGIPINFDGAQDQCGYEGYEGYNPYQNDMGGTIQSNVRSNAAGRRAETTRVTQQNDGSVRRAHHVMQTDRCGRVRKTANVDISPPY